MTNLKNTILETVKKNDIRMIPKWKFVLYSSLGITGITFTFLLAVFIFSLMLFVLSRYGFLDMPFFGFMATLHALGAIPIALFLCAIVLLIVNEVIARYYSFSFRRPLAVTLLALTAFVVFISFIISQTPIHEYVHDYAKSHRLEMMSQVYKRPLPIKREDGMNVIRGEVVETSSSTVTLKLFDGKTITAYATATADGKTTMPMPPKVDDDVVMLGTFIDDRFEILRIKPAFKAFDSQKGDRHRELRMINPEMVPMNEIRP